MRKKAKKWITTVLLTTLLAGAVPAGSAFAAVPDEISQPAEVTTFKSTENFDLEYLRGYVTADDDRVLKVVYRTPLETSLFRLSLYRIGENSGDIDLDIFIEPKMQLASDGTQTYNFTYYLNMEGLQIPDGRYAIYIRRCATEIDAAKHKYNNSGVLNKNMIFDVKDGRVKILRYMDVLRYNREIQAIGDQYDIGRYLDQSLEDIRFVLKNPATNYYADMSYSKIAFINTISNRICQGLSSNYDKLREIYEYTAGNFYYDTIAFQTHANQYADPYENLRSFEYGLTSVNSQQGKVYTTCQGYSAIFIALARAQGIPARMVYGHRAAVPSHDWITESNINIRDHWWVEAYVDGRWIFIDPTVGTTNKYDSSTRKWTSTGLTNYTYFNPTEEQIATSHLYFNIYPDYRFGYYIENDYEISTLGNFLNSYSEVDPESDDYGYGAYYGRMTNGCMLNENYNYYDRETWGDGVKSHFMTDGRGNVSQIQWSNFGFTGTLSLPDFQHMKVLSSHGNRYTAADLSGGYALEKIYLYNNEIVSMDLSDCYNAWYVRCKNNPMKDLTIYTNGRNRTFHAGDHGTFYFTLDTRYTDSAFSLYSRPELGYKVEGIYSTSTGEKLSAKKTWHFTPKAPGYDIVFCLDPNSYKYTLTPGDTQDSKIPYIQAAAKRLETLGYYQPKAYVYDSYTGTYSTYTSAGMEEGFTSIMEEAVVKFQVMHDLPNSGIIDESTWSMLFNEEAVEMVSDYEYMQVLAEYEAMIALKAETEAFMNTLDIHAASEASKGAMTITWTAQLPEAETVTEAADETASVSGDVILPEESEVSAAYAELPADAVDGYEVWKSSAKNSGYAMVRDTAKMRYKNTSGLKKGNRYYYKVRAYKTVGHETFYSSWSNITYKKAK